MTMIKVQNTLFSKLKYSGFNLIYQFQMNYSLMNMEDGTEMHEAIASLGIV